VLLLGGVLILAPSTLSDPKLHKVQLFCECLEDSKQMEGMVTSLLSNAYNHQAMIS
jgi:hypothetical protein